MKRNIILIFVIFSALVSKSQITISGFVYDAETKEAIIGANIIDSINSKGTTTNNQAYYVLRTNSPVIKVSFIGYQSQTVTVNQSNDTILNIYLNP